MNWSFLLFAFSVAVITGAIAVSALARARPGWSARKQGLVAASVLPLVALLATAAGVANLLASGFAGEIRDLALATIVRGGVVSAAVGFVGGLLGAALRQRGLRR